MKYRLKNYPWLGEFNYESATKLAVMLSNGSIVVAENTYWYLPSDIINKVEGFGLVLHLKTLRGITDIAIRVPTLTEGAEWKEFEGISLASALLKIANEFPFYAPKHAPISMDNVLEACEFSLPVEISRNCLFYVKDTSVFVVYFGCSGFKAVTNSLVLSELTEYVQVPLSYIEANYCNLEVERVHLVGDVGEGYTPAEISRIIMDSMAEGVSERLKEDSNTFDPVEYALENGKLMRVKEGSGYYIYVLNSFYSDPSVYFDGEVAEVPSDDLTSAPKGPLAAILYDRSYKVVSSISFHTYVGMLRYIGNYFQSIMGSAGDCPVGDINYSKE